MVNKGDIIKELIGQYAFKVDNSQLIESLPKFVYSRNCKYFDILNSEPAFNIFNLLGIKYRFYNNECYIISGFKNINNTVKVIDINGMNSSKGLANRSDKYKIKIKDNKGYIKTINLKYPNIITKSRKNEYQIINDNELYIHLYDFENLDLISVTNFDNKKIWLDLRNNQGGRVHNLIKILELFYNHGDVLLYLQKQDSFFKITSKLKICYKPLHIYLLVNKETASAAEMLAMKLSEFDNVTIIGAQTEGKWVLNSVKRINNYYIRFPEYEFISKSGSHLKLGCGIEPDYHISDKVINKMIIDKFYLKL